MTHHMDSLLDTADSFDIAVLDQWGVLHDGSVPYPGAVQALQKLRDAGKHIVVLSNSGKRSDLNRQRIANVGIPVDPIAHVMTSGEAVWQDLTQTSIPGNPTPPKHT